MPRSLKKTPFLSSQLFLQPIFTSRSKSKTFFKTRSSMIIPDFVNKVFQLYNGRIFFKVKVSDTIVGKKFGEFVSTRKSSVAKKLQNAR
uniref:Ribosomal protein S19 n=2 Tax=Pavlovaceae TaxID=418969 RepID=E9P697_DIALT|nr:ribosomal protein S19 [Diacronema lutheri]QHD45377.1 ribosomal protein S19 [Pavlova sp. NIVA-4/92]